jgi:spore coat polysaccharide biosynthesis protein SpsF
MDSIEKHINSKNDYSYTTGLPLGMNIEIIKGSALKESIKYIRDKSDEEHVTLAIKREKFFQKSIFSVELENVKLADLRLTVDTQIDFSLINLLISYGQSKRLSGIKLVGSFNQEYPFLFEINKNLPQKNSSTDYNEELNNALQLLSSLEYKRVVEKLKENK